MARGKPWTEDECRLIVEDYFAMLLMEWRGESFNKAEHNRLLRPFLNERSKGSVERKHQNISHALSQSQWPYIDGYKPLPNIQNLLMEAVEEYISSNKDRIKEVLNHSETWKGMPSLPGVTAWSDYFDEHPPEFKVSDEVHQRIVYADFDFAERDKRNRDLGRAGEDWVMELEKNRLRDLGCSDLADMIEHVSVTRGDGAGFDIQSFDSRGEELFIEVKTTTHHATMPFYVTPNELSVSEYLGDLYRVYRVYQFTGNRRVFELKGPISNTCLLTPTSYRAVPG